MSTVLDPAPRVAVPTQTGLSRLSAHVREHRAPARRPPTDAFTSLFEAELRLGLEAADAPRAAEAALALWRRSGDLLRCHRALARVLEAVGAACAEGELAVATANSISATALRVVAVLRSHTPAGTGPRVVLATPEADPHVLALETLAHVLEAAGHRVDVVGSVPARELVGVAAGAAAVVLSVHRPAAHLPALVSAVRGVLPRGLLAIGGAAAPEVVGADLVSCDLPTLLRALRRSDCPISERESEVLRCVADGLTNAEAATELGVAAATLKAHLDHIFDKTGTNSRAAAVAVALRHGWIR